MRLSHDSFRHAPSATGQELVIFARPLAFPILLEKAFFISSKG